MGKRRDQVRRLRPAEVHFYRKFRNFLQTALPTPDEIAGIYRVSPEAIATANGWVDGTAHLIYPGDIIKIPVGAIFPYATTTTIMTAPPTTEVCVKEKYTIQSGDSPTRVANKFGITMQQLGAANVKTKGYKNFVVGVEINIPCDAED